MEICETSESSLLPSLGCKQELMIFFLNTHDFLFLEMTNHSQPYNLYSFQSVEYVLCFVRNACVLWRVAISFLLSVTVSWASLNWLIHSVLMCCQWLKKNYILISIPGSSEYYCSSTFILFFSPELCSCSSWHCVKCSLGVLRLCLENNFFFYFYCGKLSKSSPAVTRCTFFFFYQLVHLADSNNLSIAQWVSWTLV